MLHKDIKDQTIQIGLVTDPMTPDKPNVKYPNLYVKKSHCQSSGYSVTGCNPFIRRKYQYYSKKRECTN